MKGPDFSPEEEEGGSVDREPKESIYPAWSGEKSAGHAGYLKGLHSWLGRTPDKEAAPRVINAAVEYAKRRGGEMVGRRFNNLGELVNAPETQGGLSEAARSALRQIITEGLEKGLGVSKIARGIRDRLGLSHDQAMTVAWTETAIAHNAASLYAYQAGKNMGLNIKKEWLAAGDNEVCEACRSNAAAGAIELDQPFPSGDYAPPAHPRCRCAVAPVVEE